MLPSITGQRLWVPSRMLRTPFLKATGLPAFHCWSINCCSATLGVTASTQITHAIGQKIQGTLSNLIFSRGKKRKISKLFLPDKILEMLGAWNPKRNYGNASHSKKTSTDYFRPLARLVLTKQRK